MQTWTGLIGAMRASFDEVFIYNAAVGGAANHWSSTREDGNATCFEVTSDNEAYLRRLLKTTSFSKEWSKMGFLPVIYEVRGTNDANGRRVFLGKRRVWPLSPLEQLARVAE